MIDELIPVVGRLALDEDSQHLVVMAALRGIDLQVKFPFFQILKRNTY